MTATGSPKPLISRKSIVWQALFVVALLLVARFLWTRTQPERLTPLTADNYKIADDHLYMFNLLRGIQVQSIHDSRATTLVQNDPRYPFSQPIMWSIADGYLYYAVEAPAKSGFQPHYGPSTSGRFLGIFLLPPKSLPSTQTAGQTRTKITQQSVPGKEVRIRQVSLKGGAPREAATLPTAGFCLIGNQVFWLRPGTEDTFEVRESHTLHHRIDRTYRWETTAASDLMLTSLADGSTRSIRHGLSRFSGLIQGEFGVTWSELAPYPQPPTSYYVRASDGIVHTRNMTRNQNLTLFPEFGGRLYWTVGRFDSDPTLRYHEVLMSSKTDGTDIREVFSHVEKRLVSNLSLYVYQGALYARVSTLSLPQTPNDRSPSFLFRLHPDRPDPVEILRKLPDKAQSAQFDGGFLYFVLNEPKRSLWATLTNDDVSDGNTSTLCRIPLH